MTNQGRDELLRRILLQKTPLLWDSVREEMLSIDQPTREQWHQLRGKILSALQKQEEASAGDHQEWATTLQRTNESACHYREMADAVWNLLISFVESAIAGLTDDERELLLGLGNDCLTSSEIAKRCGHRKTSSWPRDHLRRLEPRGFVRHEGTKYGLAVPLEWVRKAPEAKASAPGELIRSMREQAGLTQKDLAERIQVDQATISRWETGGAISPDKARDILLVLRSAIRRDADE